MAGKSEGTVPATPEHELRRSGRFALVIPLRVQWRDARDTRDAVFQEEAEAIEVNMHGAMLRMMTRPPLGAQVKLTNCISDEVAQARVVSAGRSRQNTVAVELLVPSETFWGITFKLKRAANDLRRLE